MNTKHQISHRTERMVTMEDRAISLNAVKDILKMANMEEFDIVAYRNIMQLPPATPKTGHWIWQTEDKYQCSCCGEVIRVKEVMNKPQYIVCPMCDARMGVSE